MGNGRLDSRLQIYDRLLCRRGWTYSVFQGEMPKCIDITGRLILSFLKGIHDKIITQVKTFLFLEA